MTPFCISLAPGVPNALGATLGQDCIEKVLPGLEAATDDDIALILDLTGIQAVNASFLKATAFWAFQCGQASVKQQPRTSDERWAVRPLRVFPAVTGCSGEVMSDVDDFFSGRQLPILHVDERTADRMIKGHLLGRLDPVLEKTLTGLVAAGEATAAELAATSDDAITLNGWNNRLADLHLLRLARRRRRSKFWVYTPTTKHISVWG
jgi:hypothetical protein